ncbi:unnamed protein product [Haemonchus placei]|uniref:TPX2 domain-containing protein n=1 Tax=Haemonchus placei TaxID=6290 RepID=A0A0N4X621_HAEPC|nr:unnamed protein product [Haemonchus placei]
MAEEEGEAASPQKMDSEAINLSEFQEKGPLVMQARMKGRIKHALDDDKSFSLKEVQFYPQYNEICIIGSDIEQLEGMSQLSMLSGEKSAELAKGARKGAYPTMAGEVKRREAEAAAREAQRVRENERRIAESAMRRRARDAAAVAAPETPSDKGRHEITSPEMHSQKSTPRKSMALERTQHSQKSVSKRSRSRQHDVIQKPSALPSQQSYTQVDDHRRAHAPVVMRKKPSNDGRHPDALGVRSYKASLSRSSKNVMEDSRSQKTSSTDSEGRSGRLLPQAARHNQQDSYSDKRSPHH